MIKKILRIGILRLLFLLVLALYMAVWLSSPALLQGTLTMFFRILWSILPVLFLVFGIMFISNLLFEPKAISRYLGKGSGIRGWLLATAGGILSTGPIYMWYPLLSDLKSSGMKKSLIAAFLYNRAVKIPMLPVMMYYFGWEFTIILTIYMIIFSVINGIVVEKIGGGE